MRPNLVPERAGDHAGGEQRQPGDEIEHAESGPTQLRRRCIRNQSRQQALRESHMQAPQDDAAGKARNTRRESQDKIGAQEKKQA